MVLLALSDPAVTALAAIGGAVVGAVAGFFADFGLGWSKDSTRAKAGARLISVELTKSATLLFSVERDRAWWVFQDVSIDRTWLEYRDVLAARLNNEDFDQVSIAIVGLNYLAEGNKKMFESTGLDRNSLSDDAVGRVHQARSDVTAAHNALASLAGRESAEAGWLLGEET